MANPVTGGLKRIEVAAANTKGKAMDTKGVGKSSPKMAVSKKPLAKVKKAKGK